MNHIYKETMVVSFSGGRTSAYMCYMLITFFSHLYNFVFIFANTGLELEETLIFVARCDKKFRLNLVWVEAVVNPVHGVGITHKIVDFNYASRKGEPFEAFIAKSGIPNANKPQCSDRLKAIPIEHYKKMNGLKNCVHAIGMRSDEPNRVLSKTIRDRLSEYGLSNEWIKNFSYKSKTNKSIELVIAGIQKSLHTKLIGKYNLIYPLHSIYFKPATKSDVNGFWDAQEFNLEIEEHEGNCATCWKKSDKKLWLLALESPERYDFMRRMEKTYQHVKPNNDGKPRVFFRRHRSVEDLFLESELTDPYSLRKMIGYTDEDLDSGCSESCEAYTI